MRRSSTPTGFRLCSSWSASRFRPDLDGQVSRPAVADKDRHLSGGSAGTSHTIRTRRGRPYGAIRDGDWMLVESYDGAATELYNLASDIGEQNNVAARHAQRVAELRPFWANGFRPLRPDNRRNPDFDRSSFGNSMKMWMPAVSIHPCDRCPVGNHAAVAQGHERRPALKTMEKQRPKERTDRRRNGQRTEWGPKDCDADTLGS